MRKVRQRKSLSHTQKTRKRWSNLSTSGWGFKDALLVLIFWNAACCKRIRLHGTIKDLGRWVWSFFLHFSTGTQDM